MIIRPDYITEDQIERWNEELAKDAALQANASKEVLEDPVLREVLYSSLWLKEKLWALGYDAFTLGEVSIVHGMNSFEANSWQVAETLLEIYSSETMLANLKQNSSS